jgi:hypothetical protein
MELKVGAQALGAQLIKTPARARIFYVYKASIFIFLALSLVVKPSLAMQPLGRFESLFL